MVRMVLIGGRDGRCCGLTRFFVVVEFYLADEFFGRGHAQVGLVLGVVALHYADESDDDVSAVVGLFLNQAVELGGGCGHVSLGAVFVFRVNSPEGSADVGSSEVSLSFFEADPCEYAGCGYLVRASVVFVSESVEAYAVFYLHEGAFEVAHDVSSVVGLFEDDLSELWVWSYLGQFSISDYELSIRVAHMGSVRECRVRMFEGVVKGDFCKGKYQRSGGRRYIHEGHEGALSDYLKTQSEGISSSPQPSP